jgi:hypothetical protein
VLWRRREPKTKALGEAEGRQKAHEADWKRASTAESLLGRVEVRLREREY